jgi:glutamate-1-semialdehyde aminotransferase
MNTKYPSITKSNEWFKRSQGLIPSYTQTLAKGPTQYVNGVAPKFLVSGEGAHVWDADGNELIDFNMAIGPVSLGYKYPRIDNAIRRALEDGISFSLVHPLEVQLSELIREVVPNAECVRISKTGADVTSAAIRVARACTGKDKILCCGYHGWHDWYIGTTPRGFGVPQAIKDLVHTFNYNDIDSVADSIDGDTACVILEPMVFEEPKNNFLQRLRALCNERRVLLIFDEMWTGFRFALGGAQEYFGVTADLACYSKAVANGMPISILAGKAEFMNILNDKVFFYTTFGGETLSIAAAIATIREMREKDVISSIASKGALIKKGLSALIEKNGLENTVSCTGHPARTIVNFAAGTSDPLLCKSYIQQELIRSGILWSGYHNMCFSHSKNDIEHLLDAYAEILPRFRKHFDGGMLQGQLRGEPVQPVFRRTQDFNTKPLAR